MEMGMETGMESSRRCRKSFYDNFSRVSSFDQASARRAEKTHSSMNVNMIFNHIFAPTVAHLQTHTHQYCTFTHKTGADPALLRT